MLAAATRPSSLVTATLVRLGEITNRTLVLPIAVFFPTGRCNSRCESCDWWTSTGAGELSLEEIGRVADALATLGTRLVLFSGGEPLLRGDILEIADLFRDRGVLLHLHTSGLQLDRMAAAVGHRFARVIVSLDAADEALYQRIRGVPALPIVEHGIARLRRTSPEVTVTLRATLHRLNFRELSRLVDRAKALAVDGISFLAADLSATAFSRRDAARVQALALAPDEVAEFRDVVEDAIDRHRDDFASGYIAESPDRLRRLPQYYAALSGRGEFPPVSCNAPSVSVVIEADGTVRPCFFQPPIGSVRSTPLVDLVKRNLPAFRRTLDVSSDPICRRCVCSLKTGWRAAPWH
jgi:MoaA/NifB/PqqE/SkfB family radical SAM enzyme